MFIKLIRLEESINLLIWNLFLKIINLFINKMQGKLCMVDILLKKMYRNKLKLKKKEKVKILRKLNKFKLLVKIDI
jgi:hypothetical protein